jgi:hypothetical protein
MILDKDSTEPPAAFARRLGVHKSTVSRAIAAGRLLLVAGRLDIADSLRRWHDTKPGTRPDVLARHAAKRAPANVVAVQAAEIAPRAPESAATEDSGERSAPVVADPGIGEYTQQLLAAQNALARLSISLRTFRRYPLDMIEREAQALGSTLRGALERLVDQTAPRLAVYREDGPRADVLAGEIIRLRQTMRREMPRALRRMRQLDRVK